MGNYVQNKAINEIVESRIKLNRYDVIRKINMKFKVLEYLAITYEFWEKKKSCGLFLTALSIATVFMQAISINFSLPALEFLESNGAPHMLKDY